MLESLLSGVLNLLDLSFLNYIMAVVLFISQDIMHVLNRLNCNIKIVLMCNAFNNIEV